MENIAVLSKDSLTFYDCATGDLVFKCTFERLRLQAELLRVKYSDCVKSSIEWLLNHFNVSPTSVTII